MFSRNKNRRSMREKGRGRRRRRGGERGREKEREVGGERGRERERAEWVSENVLSSIPGLGY
jgi:hypothetical protein